MKKLKFLTFCLFFLFNINVSVAELTKTQDTAVRPGPANGSYIDLGGNPEIRDALEAPTGGTFNKDGTIVFFTNNKPPGAGGKTTDSVTVMRVSTPYDLRTISKIFQGGDPIRDIAGVTDTNDSRVRDIDFNNNGTKLFLTNTNGKVYPFDLKIPYSFAFGSGMSFTTDSEVDLGGTGELEFNNDGTKMYFIDGGENPTVDEYNLTTAFDISTRSLINSTTLSADISDSASGAVVGFAFNDTGTGMHVLLQDTGGFNDTIFQYRLTVAFDTSTAVFVGKADLNSGLKLGLFQNNGVNVSHIFTGLFFDATGSKMYIVNDAVPDLVHQISLPCKFGVAVCMADTASNIVSHVEFAKKNIHYNNSTLFKRFEWIKRNRNNENLNSFNINLKSYNPILASLTNKLQASLDNNSSKIKSSTWSFWSTGDVSIGRQDATITDKPKKIHTSGLTFGADKKLGDDKFAGFALRYAKNDSSVTNTDQSSDMESLTLNFYGTTPKNETNYVNMILGYSLLRIDQKYLGKKTGNRNGHQLFTSANFRSKNKSGRFNFSPSGRFSYGITKLSDYTDFISSATTGLNDQHDNKTIKNGNLASGFLFDTDPYKFPDGTITPNGGFEFVVDVSPETRFTYDNGKSSALVDVYSAKNFKGNLGFEVIFTNDSTLSLNYERFQHLDLRRSGKTETFILKIGKIIEGDSEFALNYDPINAHQTNLSYSKSIHGLDFKINSNQSLENNSEYFTNLEVSGKF